MISHDIASLGGSDVAEKESISIIDVIILYENLDVIG